MQDSGYPYPADRLMAALDGARLVRYDADGYLLAWFGGHGVHVYDAAGEEVHFWNCGDFAQNDADVADVEASIAAYLNGDDEDEKRREAMRDAGRRAGRAAGSWVSDGNSTEEHLREVLRAIEECEFEIPAPLSGEFADGWTPERAFEDAEVPQPEDPDEESSLLDAWEDGYREAYEAQASQDARGFLPDADGAGEGEGS